MPLYEAVYETFGCRENDVSPLVFNDADQSLEDNLARLSECIVKEGSIVTAVKPIIDSLDQFIQDKANVDATQLNIIWCCHQHLRKHHHRIAVVPRSRRDRL